MIPNQVVLTYKHNNIPPYILHNIKALNPEKQILFFTDNDAVQFLTKEYDSSYADFFLNLNLGCTKGDFFRYCYLFKYGGYYCDIDIYHLLPIQSYISKNTEFFTINSGACQNTTFQALLFCIKEHPIIKQCIADIMDPISANDTFYNTTKDMYKNISNYLQNDVVYPMDYKINNNQISIGQEIFAQNQWVCTYKEKMIALSRYPNYVKENPGTNKEIGFFV